MAHAHAGRRASISTILLVRSPRWALRVSQRFSADWEPSDGSLNTYHGKHALGQRASKIKDGILVIRFECPWHIFCAALPPSLPPA